MAVEVVRYPARDGQGRLMTWVGVRRYYCPEGCSTAFYDFKKARLVGPGAADGRTQALQAAAWLLTGLYVAVGVVLLYALFMYGVSVIPVPAPWVRVLLWLLVTAGFATLAALLLRAPAGRPEGLTASGQTSMPARAGSDGAARSSSDAVRPSAAAAGAAPTAGTAAAATAGTAAAASAATGAAASRRAGER